MRQRVKTIWCAVGLISIAGICLAADKPLMKMTATNSSMKSSAKMQGYLGIGVAPLPSALVSQLPNVLGQGYGVLVAEVAADSPAHKAGLKANDVLITYDDQRLYSPDQFVKLVHYDKPDRQVKLGVVHDGKSEDLKVDLGERPEVANQQEYPMGMHWPMRTEKPMTAEEEEARWNSFDSLTLSRTGKDQFKAEIKFRNDSDKLETKDFQGTRDQIRKDINAQKDLPTNEREQLLRAISLSRNPWEAEFPYVEFNPNTGVLWDFIESGQPSSSH